MNPEGELAKDPAMAKGAGGKTGKYKGKLIRPKEVKIDPNFFSGRHKQEMKAAQGAKFSQSPELLELLLATNDKLTHFVRGSEPVVFTELMEVRRELKDNKTFSNILIIIENDSIINPTLVYSIMDSITVMKPHYRL